MSINDNIIDLCDFIEKAKTISQLERFNKTPANSRNRTFILLIDREKAFDSVNRNILIRKLQ